MQTEIDPVFALPDKLLLLSVAALRKEPGLRPFHGEADIPAVMVHAPYAAHTARDCFGCDFVCIKDQITVPDLLI